MFIPILAGTLLFILLSFFINTSIFIYKQKRRQHEREILLLKQTYEQQLLQSQIEVQESTYRHIAKELHDNVGQLLSTTKMLMGVTELKMDHVPDTLCTADATLTKAIQELRLVSRSLDKEWLEQFDFLENLQAEIARINASETIKATISCPSRLAMKAEEQIILFRIVQEAMQNAIRHGLPSQLDVIISNGQQLEVQVINNGKPLPAGFTGMGTTNMKQRARLFGGTVQWNCQQEQTTVTILLPLNHAHEN